MTAAERKRDAHEKIQLGGVVIKAGLRTVDKAVLLGALLEVAALDPGSDRYQRLKEKGREAFQREPSTRKPTGLLRFGTPHGLAPRAILHALRAAGCGGSVHRSLDPHSPVA